MTEEASFLMPTEAIMQHLVGLKEAVDTGKLFSWQKGMSQIIPLMMEVVSHLEDLEDEADSPWLDAETADKFAAVLSMLVQKIPGGVESLAPPEKLALQEVTVLLQELRADPDPEVD